MRLLISNHMANAIESLRSNRLRTTLTILGVTIGVASITVILSLSAGASKIISTQVDELGDTVAVVRPRSSSNNTQITNLAATFAGSSVTSSLTERDASDMQGIKDMKAVAPLMLIGGSVTSSEGTTPSNSYIVATTTALPNAISLPLSDGQFFDDSTNNNTAVIGNQLSVDLFGTDQSIGKTFDSHGTTFRVIGILKPLNNPVNYNNVDFDHAAIINLNSGKSFNQGVASIQQIDLRAVSQQALPGVLSEAKQLLARNHQSEKDYTVLSGKKLAQPTNELFTAIAVTLTTVAAVSLFVGGIGIMNIMLVSVTERTREIGVRKALGASTAHITWQFLIEALFMSLSGGILGYIFGYLFAFTIARVFLSFDPQFTWLIAGYTLGVSLAVGMLFGLYPAVRAARKDPIEALRNYH